MFQCIANFPKVTRAYFTYKWMVTINIKCLIFKSFSLLEYFEGARLSICAQSCCQKTPLPFRVEENGPVLKTFLSCSELFQGVFTHFCNKLLFLHVVF
jgi:hypothetical protein